MKSDQQLSRLPAIGRLLESEALKALELPRWAVVAAARSRVEALRAVVRAGGPLPEETALVASIELEARRLSRPSLRRVINATGVVVHTNLGRAPLSSAAIDAVVSVAGSYSNLEYDLQAGKRGSRHAHASAALTQLTGAEASMVVNNNAAAIFLCMSALAAGREVLVSRGELVEIGGSFRVPDMLAAGGAKLVEVGTTNRTRLADYERAITEQTALILKVHPSNFRVVGFTEAAQRADLAKLAHSRGITMVEDLGSGRLMAGESGHWAGEPHVREALEAGADLVTFSGDKLLGGPQAGLICGRGQLMEQLRRHPLARVLRVDKMTLAALNATLGQYAASEAMQIPVVAALSLKPGELAEAARALADALGAACGVLSAQVTVVAGSSQAGGGSMPEAALETSLVRVAPLRLSAAAVEARLRAVETPVVVRVQGDALLLDPRTLLDGDVPDVVRAMVEALGG